MSRINQVSKYDFDNPAFFEEIHKQRFNVECEFLTQIFHAQGAITRVLDIACGTGAHAAILAENGFEVTGIDLNAHMVDFARSQHPALDFRIGDMRDLRFRSAFDAVICLCTSFSYNTTNEDVVAALRGIRRALRSGGVLVIDVFNPISLIQTRGFLSHIKDQGRYAQLNLSSTRDVTIDERQQLLIERRTLAREDDGATIQSDNTRFRLFFPQEFRYFLETNGFKLVEFYSAFDLEQKALSGSRLITISKKN